MEKLEVVKCPKCDGTMVPLSEAIQERVGSVKVVPYAEWRCVKCLYSVQRLRSYG